MEGVRHQRPWMDNSCNNRTQPRCMNWTESLIKFSENHFSSLTSSSCISLMQSLSTLAENLRMLQKDWTAYGLYGGMGTFMRKNFSMVCSGEIGIKTKKTSYPQTYIPLVWHACTFRYYLFHAYQLCMKSIKGFTINGCWVSNTAYIKDKNNALHLLFMYTNV